MPALYLAETVATATAEWYRSLAEWDSRPRTTFPTTTIAGASTSSLPTSATSRNYVASRSRLRGRAETHGLPTNV